MGFAVQALVTREQPLDGLTKHLADPFGHNIIRCTPNPTQRTLSALFNHSIIGYLRKVRIAVVS